MGQSTENCRHQDRAKMPKLPSAGFMLHDAIAGGLAGLITRLVTSPLDIIKIRFQLQLESTFKV